MPIPALRSHPLVFEGLKVDDGQCLYSQGSSQGCMSLWCHPGPTNFDLSSASGSFDLMPWTAKEGVQVPFGTPLPVMTPYSSGGNLPRPGAGLTPGT